MTVFLYSQLLRDYIFYAQFLLAEQDIEWKQPLQHGGVYKILNKNPSGWRSMTWVTWRFYCDLESWTSEEFLLCQAGWLQDHSRLATKSLQYNANIGSKTSNIIMIVAHYCHIITRPVDPVRGSSQCLPGNRQISRVAALLFTRLFRRVNSVRQHAAL